MESLVLALSYLMGSVPFGVLIGKAWAGIDIRKHGSGNIGMTNVLRTMGKLPALLVLLLDVGKGFGAVHMVRFVTAEAVTSPVVLAGGVLAIVGHNWPVFLRFRGGRGIATSLGVVLAVSPGIGLGLIALWIVLVALTRYVSVASIAASVLLPVLVYVSGEPSAYLVASLLMAVSAVGRHAPNIRRLVVGTEHKFGGKRTG